MKKILPIICAVFIIACGQPQEKTADDKVIINDTAGIETIATVEDDCVFDLTTQNDDFMKEIPDYSNYTWDDESKTATVVFDNNDTIRITMGGCTHYNYYIEFITKTTDSLSIKNPGYGLKIALELAQKVFPKADHQLIDSLVTNKLYDAQLLDVQNYYSLHQDLYCDMTILMEETKSGLFRLEIGYYMC